MRKFLAVVALVTCLFVSGCAYRSVNGVRIQGKNVDCTYSAFTQSFAMKGEALQVTLLRQSTLASSKTATTIPQLYSLPDIKEGDLSFELIQVKIPEQATIPVTAVMDVK